MVAWSSTSNRKFNELLTYNCYETGHTWSPHCWTAAYMVATVLFKECSKLYAIYYLIRFLIKRKKMTKKDAIEFLKSVLRSTLFISGTGFFFLVFICQLRKCKGKLTVLTTSFVPAFLACMTCVNLETSSRIQPLTGYIANVTLETAFYMLESRNIIRSIPNGEVLLFSCAIAVYMYHEKKGDLVREDLVSAALKFLGSSSTWPVSGMGGHYFKSFSSKIEALPRHPSCSHDYSCLFSCSYGFLRAFIIGCLCRTSVNLAKQLSRNPKGWRTAVLDINNANLGLFLGIFVLLHKSVGCVLRWTGGKDRPCHAIPTGFIAGLSMYFMKTPSVAIYVAWRLVEVYYEWGMDAGYLPSSQVGLRFFFSLCVAILLHAAIIEPHNLKPSYFTFLDRISRGILTSINRHLLDVFNLESSKKFPHLVPKLDKRYMSAEGIAHMKKLFPSF